MKNDIWKNWKFCSSDVCLLNPPRPLLNLLTVSHLTTLCSVSLEPPPKTRFLRLPAVALVLSYPWAFHTATHLTFWILLLRIVFYNSETTSFKNIGIQYLSSSFVFHLLQTFFSVFLDEFNSSLSFAATIPHEFIITGDFNIHLDNHSDHATSQFLSLLSSFDLTQHVNFPTHNQDHIRDLVITSSDSSLAPPVSVTHCSPSEHFPIFTKLSVERTPPPPPTFHSFRRLHSIDINSFKGKRKGKGKCIYIARFL